MPFLKTVSKSFVLPHRTKRRQKSINKLYNSIVKLENPIRFKLCVNIIKIKFIITSKQQINITIKANSATFYNKNAYKDEVKYKDNYPLLLNAVCLILEFQLRYPQLKSGLNSSCSPKSAL